MQTRPPTRADQARRFATFLRGYNEERPHESLGQRPPASVYQPSPPAMPTRLAQPDYPAEAAARQVRSNGAIKWRADFIHGCSALIGVAVAVHATEDGY